MAEMGVVGRALCRQQIEQRGRAFAIAQPRAVEDAIGIVEHAGFVALHVLCGGAVQRVRGLHIDLCAQHDRLHLQLRLRQRRLGLPQLAVLQARERDRHRHRQAQRQRMLGRRIGRRAAAVEDRGDARRVRQGQVHDRIDPTVAANQRGVGARALDGGLRELHVAAQAQRLSHQHVEVGRRARLHRHAARRGTAEDGVEALAQRARKIQVGHLGGRAGRRDIGREAFGFDARLAQFQQADVTGLQAHFVRLHRVAKRGQAGLLARPHRLRAA